MVTKLDIQARPHPQLSYSQTTIHPDSFFGKLRALYADTVLKTQLDQLKKQGSYDAFKLKWHPAYDVRPLKGAKSRQDGIPPSLFWESDVGKWVEAVCYFLGSEGHDCAHKEEFTAAVQELVDMIEKAQQPDGYLNIYFTVVDPEGRFQNFRDMHEMYNAGHLLEAAIAHYKYTGSRQFLDVMIKNVACFAKALGPNSDQLHAYPGHPEFELALLRLYAITQDPEHLKFANYLLEERGQPREEYGNVTFFIHEAKKRNDYLVASNMTSIENVDYAQAHIPLHQQDNILGHSVRALYLTTAAADIGGEFLEDAKRLLENAAKYKMYVTGGLGSEPKFEGFHPSKYRLPQSTAEGGCYAETCASIAAMMTCERVLSWENDGETRDVMELCLYNAVLGGGSLDGKSFSYANKMATCDNEVATRNEWFEVCCCPPNLSRTLGMLGGYSWNASVDAQSKSITVDVYLFVSATRTIPLPDGQTAQITQSTQMPWTGSSKFDLSAPEGWTWKLNLPKPSYGTNFSFYNGASDSQSTSGFFNVTTKSNKEVVEYTFDLPIHVLASHPLTGQDTLTVKKGPIVYAAESADNESLEKQYPHFEGVGIKSAEKAKEADITIEGLPLRSITLPQGEVFVDEGYVGRPAFAPVSADSPARNWKEAKEGLVLVPWFARANRGGAGHVRTSFLRAE